MKIEDKRRMVTWKIVHNWPTNGSLHTNNGYFIWKLSQTTHTHTENSTNTNGKILTFWLCTPNHVITHALTFSIRFSWFSFGLVIGGFSSAFGRFSSAGDQDSFWSVSLVTIGTLSVTQRYKRVVPVGRKSTTDPGTPPFFNGQQYQSIKVSVLISFRVNQFPIMVFCRAEESFTQFGHY